MGAILTGLSPEVPMYALIVVQAPGSNADQYALLSAKLTEQGWKLMPVDWAWSRDFPPDQETIAGLLAEQNVAYFNDGAGALNAGSANFGTGNDNTHSVALGDVDGDGDLDVAVGNNNSEQNVIYLNDGFGDYAR